MNPHEWMQYLQRRGVPCKRCGVGLGFCAPCLARVDKWILQGLYKPPMKDTSTIDAFTGNYRWLSNFYPCAITDVDGITFPTVEHAYQAQKYTDREVRLRIAGKRTPGEAKRAGRELPHRRENWDAIKVTAMLVLLRHKFVQPLFKELLLATGDRQLIEGNTWGDTFWGVCRGKGENNLGKLLMEIREEALKNSGT